MKEFKLGFLKYFYEISKIPRKSGNEEKIAKYLIEFAKLIIRYEEEFCERDFTYNNLTPLGKKTNFLLEKECYNQNIENIRLHLGGKV